MKLRVLFAIHGPNDPRTAVYLNVEHRARHLREEGHQVDILTADELRHGKWARFDPLWSPVRLLRCGLSAYDVIVFHSYMGWAFHAGRRWFDPNNRVTTITAFHGLEPLYFEALADELRRSGRSLSLRFRLLHLVILPRLLRASCRASDSVFCLNRAEVEYLAQHRWAESDRIHLVSNGVDAEFFAQPQQRASARRLLFIGQWLPAKGIRYLVEAFSTLAEQRDVELACVGTGARSEVVLRAFPEHVRSRVSVLPRAERSRIREELSGADVFVFPSLSEGFSSALLEAMAAGRAIVATPVGAAADLLEDDKNAIIVRCADSEALAAGITRLLDHRSIRERLGHRAQQNARNYEWTRCSSKFSKELTDAVVHRRKTAGQLPLTADNAIP